MVASYATFRRHFMFFVVENHRGHARLRLRFRIEYRVGQFAAQRRGRHGHIRISRRRRRPHQNFVWLPGPETRNGLEFCIPRLGCGVMARGAGNRPLYAGRRKGNMAGNARIVRRIGKGGLFVFAFVRPWRGMA